MEFVPSERVVEYLPIKVELGFVVVFDEVGDGSAGILDLLVAVTERVEYH